MLEVCALTDPGQVRRSNQDAFRIVRELGLFMLADGMGGARGGEQASQMAVEAIEKSIRRSSHRDAAALLSAVEEANDLVLSAASHDPSLEGMGTTVVAVLETRPNDLAIASVGDSRAYVLHDGELRAVTKDQTWVEEVGAGMGLDEASLRKHPMRHVLTMAVGVASAVRILYYAVELAVDDTLLLTTDGLHGVVPDCEIGRILREGEGTLQQRCERLMEAAHAAGSPDNVTVMLMRPARENAGAPA
ncbi:MAG TPA: protein phosphatase 2C domain-containing protein [Bryobacteraceae bacterium]|nr:protein phosphatase 2C domain-containing protein [Bryobacteraceae bacterium]HVY92989.1 protein phosphatase 2C domain-containing protein [Bryobacteraceae bacterium]